MVAVPGGELAVYERGEGDPVLLHPSLGRPASDFEDLVERIAAGGRRAVAVDPRGIGMSSGDLSELKLTDCAQDLVRIADSLGISDFDAIGHAFGNRVVRLLAMLEPERVRRIVLLAAGGRFEGDEDARAALRNCFDPELDEHVHLAAVRTAFFAGSNDARVWIDGWHPEVAAAQARAVQSISVDNWWLGGTAPMLVVQGLDDRVAPTANGRSLAEERPTVTLVELENAGHALLPEQPEAIAAAVLDFLR